MRVRREAVGVEWSLIICESSTDEMLVVDDVLDNEGDMTVVGGMNKRE